MTTEFFIDQDGDMWLRGKDRNEVILIPPDPGFNETRCLRSEIGAYSRWPTTMAVCAAAAFEALWPNESVK